MDEMANIFSRILLTEVALNTVVTEELEPRLRDKMALMLSNRMFWK